MTRGADRRSTGLRSLAVRYSLSDRAIARLSALLDLIESDPSAPTTIRRPDQAINDHLSDSLVALELDVVRDAEAIADLGSGAGFPGLPLALALPQAGVVMIDGNARKAAFIKRAIDVCELANARAIHARAEAWPEGADQFDLVTARALAAPDVVAEYAAPLLRLGGTLVTWRGRRDPEAELAATRAATVLGLEMTGVIPVMPYPGAQHRHMHLMRKVGETPARFPRRPGIARKRPLGAKGPV
jgi:16S rRNA (guanine527-N7)-methyltransferase